MKQLIKKLPKEFIQPLKYIRDQIPDYYRYGSEYRTVYNKINELEFATESDIVKYQQKQLQSLLQYAYDNVNYYKKIFNERNITPKDIKDLRDLNKLPYLTKDIIRENFSDLISNQYKKKDLSYITTGGSTGTPLGFYEDNNTSGPREWAFVTQIWKRSGYDVKKRNRFAIIRGSNVENGIVEYNGGNLILSSYHLTEKSIPNYIKMLEKYNPDYIQAYPSSLDIISKYLLMNRKTIRVNNLKSIFCSSEQLYNFQRENIKKAFGVSIFNLYGQTEHCCIAGECEKSTFFHIQPEYGVVELINENGIPVSKDNEKGEIIATSFNNYAMPFIRYKTGDIGINSNEKCSCGRNYKIIKGLDGRELEQIITHSGAKVSLTALIFAQHFHAFSKIQSMQLEQMEKGKVTVNIVEQKTLTNEDKNEIITKMKSATGNNLDVEVKVIQDISRTKRGKHKFLIQHLNLSDIN